MLISRPGCVLDLNRHYEVHLRTKSVSATQEYRYEENIKFLDVEVSLHASFYEVLIRDFAL